MVIGEREIIVENGDLIVRFEKSGKKREKSGTFHGGRNLKGNPPLNHYFKKYGNRSTIN